MEIDESPLVPRKRASRSLAPAPVQPSPAGAGTGTGVNSPARGGRGVWGRGRARRGAASGNPALASESETPPDAESLARVLVHGWLLKRTGEGRTWRRRYALLADGGKLLYFKSRRACALYLQFVQIRERGGSGGGGGNGDSAAERSLLQGCLDIEAGTPPEEYADGGVQTRGWRVAVRGGRIWMLCPPPELHAAWGGALRKAAGASHAVRDATFPMASVRGLATVIRELEDEVGPPLRSRRRTS